MPSSVPSRAAAVSSLLRMTLGDGSRLFGKIYATSHARADRREVRLVQRIHPVELPQIDHELLGQHGQADRRPDRDRRHVAGVHQRHRAVVAPGSSRKSAYSMITLTGMSRRTCSCSASARARGPCLAGRNPANRKRSVGKPDPQGYLLCVQQINERLDNMFRLLTGGSRVALERQQTLRALVTWSYDLLQEREQTLLDRLSGQRQPIS